MIIKAVIQSVQELFGLVYKYTEKNHSSPHRQSGIKNGIKYTIESYFKLY